MSMVAKSNKRIAALFAIFLAVFSTGIVIAHQCHSMLSNQVSVQHGHLGHDSAPTAAAKPLNGTSNTERLIDSGCVALFIAVLFFGRKLLNLKAPRSALNSLMALSRDLATAFRPQVLHLALSRPQLGVIRI